MGSKSEESQKYKFKGKISCRVKAWLRCITGKLKCCIYYFSALASFYDQEFFLDFISKISYIKALEKGGVAQLAEQWNHNPRVRGSSPCAATLYQMQQFLW